MIHSLLLAIEVSQREGGVALGRIGAPISEAVEVGVGPPDHSRDQLMPAIESAFRSIDAAPSELAAVAVSHGPGGFTGLRMAVATAKALALGTGCKVIALRSALVAVRTAVLSRAALDLDTGVIVALASKGGDAWLSLVRRDGPTERIAHEGIADVAEFERLIERTRERPALMADEHLPPTIAASAERLGLPRLPLRLSAKACLEVGQKFHAEDCHVDADALAPLYPREPEAVRLWREKLARTSRAAPEPPEPPEPRRTGG